MIVARLDHHDENRKCKPMNLLKHTFAFVWRMSWRWTQINQRFFPDFRSHKKIRLESFTSGNVSERLVVVCLFVLYLNLFFGGNIRFVKIEKGGSYLSVANCVRIIMIRNLHSIFQN